MWYDIIKFLVCQVKNLIIFYIILAKIFVMIVDMKRLQGNAGQRGILNAD